MNQSSDSAARSGRSMVAPWVVASVAILSSFAATRLWRHGRLDQFFKAGQDSAQVADAPEEIQVWQGYLALSDDLTLECSLAPFHSDPELENFRSSRLGLQQKLEPGSLMRLLMTRTDSNGEALVFTGFEVLDAEGSCVRDLASLLEPDADVDSLLTLIGRRGAILDSREEEQIAGWGRAPGSEARLILKRAEGDLELVLESRLIEPERLPRSFARQAESPASGGRPASPVPQMDDEQADPAQDELDAQSVIEHIASLEAELAAARARVQELELGRVAREEEILRFSVLLSGLPLPGDVRSKLGLIAPAEEQADDEEKPSAPDPNTLRAAEIKLALRTLLSLEGMYALDLLEVGEVHAPLPEREQLNEAGESVSLPAESGWVGPVMFRLLDSFGRLNGSLHAERLHLEGSRATRTLHVILNAGYEAHRGERTPFSNGLRRISLPLVDPEPWIERLPELFAPGELNPENDDGLWELGPLRLQLNELLGQGSRAGWYRLHGFGGVLGDELRDVQLQEFDSRGSMRRRLFADSLRLSIDENGVHLNLVGGGSADASGMLPFRNSTLSIFLPEADQDAWRKHKLPGLQGSGAPETEQASE